jgi:DNA-binding beta-propeller fold protein YncE
VIVADFMNHRVQVLRLVVGADNISTHLEFVCSLGSGQGSAEGNLKYSFGVALLQSNGGQQETVLVTEQGNHRVSQFALDTFIGIFAGTGKQGSGDGEFDVPRAITVLGSSGEVAVAEFHNHRVQIFDSEGNYKRQFGTKGKEADGQLCSPAGLASDAHGNLLVVDLTNRLQVFDPEGKHLCTRSDLGLQNSTKGIAWSTGGEIAVADGKANKVLVWHSA